MKLHLLHRNKEWLYSVYRSEDKSTYLLCAIFPGVGWDEIAIILSNDEIDLLRNNQSEFLSFVKHITDGRNKNEAKVRRIHTKSISEYLVEI